MGRREGERKRKRQQIGSADTDRSTGRQLSLLTIFSTVSSNGSFQPSDLHQALPFEEKGKIYCIMSERDYESYYADKIYMYNQDDDIYNNTIGFFGEGACVWHNVETSKIAGKYNFYNGHIHSPTIAFCYQPNFCINVCNDCQLADRGIDQTQDHTLSLWQSVLTSSVSFLLRGHSQCFDYAKDDLMPSCSPGLHDLLQLSHTHYSDRTSVLSWAGSHSLLHDYEGEVLFSSYSLSPYDRRQCILHICMENHCMDKRCIHKYFVTQSRPPLCTHFRGMANACGDCIIKTYSLKGSSVGDNKHRGKSVKLLCSLTYMTQPFNNISGDGCDLGTHIFRRKKTLESSSRIHQQIHHIEKCYISDQKIIPERSCHLIKYLRSGTMSIFSCLPPVFGFSTSANAAINSAISFEKLVQREEGQKQGATGEEQSSTDEAAMLEGATGEEQLSNFRSDSWKVKQEQHPDTDKQLAVKHELHTDEEHANLPGPSNIKKNTDQYKGDVRKGPQATKDRILNAIDTDNKCRELQGKYVDVPLVLLIPKNS